MLEQILMTPFRDVDHRAPDLLQLRGGNTATVHLEQSAANTDMSAELGKHQFNRLDQGVDLVGAYSKLPGLAERLVRTVQRVRHAQSKPPKERASVRSTGRSERQWRVTDRLSAADVRRLVAAFETGTPKWKLADRYGISESSVKRVIRRHRAQHPGT